MVFEDDFPKFYDFYPLKFKNDSPELDSFLKLHIGMLDYNYDFKNHSYNYNFLSFYFLYMFILFSYNFKKDYCELNFEDRKKKNIYSEFKKENGEDLEE